MWPPPSSLQLQFFVLFIHFGRPLIMRDCSYYPIIIGFCFLQNTFMIAMFSDFYIKTYIRTNKPLTARQ